MAINAVEHICCDWQFEAILDSVVEPRVWPIDAIVDAKGLMSIIADDSVAPIRLRDERWSRES